LFFFFFKGNTTTNNGINWRIFYIIWNLFLCVKYFCVLFCGDIFSVLFSLLLFVKVIKINLKK